MFPVLKARPCAWWAALLLGALAGCDGNLSDNLAPEGSFRALHAAPDLHEVRLRVEDRAQGDIGDLEYGEATTGLVRVGEASYSFSFRRVLPGDTQFTDILRFSQRIAAARQHTFVLAGSAATPELVTWIGPEREFTAEDTVLAAAVGHAAQGAPAVDAYLGAPGFDPAAALPVASLAFGDYAAGLELAAGEYQLVLTARGDPAQVVFTSSNFTLFAATDVLFAVLAGADIGTGGLLVRVIGAGTVETLTDQSSMAELRAFHGALGTDAVDVVLDDDFVMPVASGLAFQADGPYAPAMAGARVLGVTAAGNPGAPLAEADVDIDGGTRLTAYLTGEPGDLEVVTLADDNRRLADLARLRVFHSAAAAQFVDVFVVDAGQDFTRFAPTIQDLEYRTGTAPLAAPPGAYDIVVTLQNTATVLAGPLRVNLEAGGIYGAVAVDVVAGDAVDIVLLDDF